MSRSLARPGEKRRGWPRRAAPDPSGPQRLSERVGKGRPSCPIHRREWRIAEVAARRLVEKSSAGSVSLVVEDGDLCLRVGDQDHPLSRREAVRLREQLATALSRTWEFLRTTGTHRADGSYVVARRGVASAGHSKVFRSFSDLEALHERLPPEFGAGDVGRTGLTGGRRHMVVHHLAEHPAFDCSLVASQPLTARKAGDDGGSGNHSGDATPTE